MICDKYNVMHVIKDCRLELRGLKGQTLSVLSYTDESQGVTLSGMKYPLENIPDRAEQHSKRRRMLG